MCAFIVSSMPPRGNGWSGSRTLRRRRTYIAEWRIYRGFTQEGLAERLDTTKATISRIENAKMQYSQDFLEALAHVLGVHESVLISRPPRPDDDMPPPEVPTATRRARQ